VPNFRRLSNDPDFETLFTEGPLADEIRGLEEKLRSMDLNEPVEVMRIKARLSGILLVRECVKKQADAEVATANAMHEAREKAKPRRWAERYLPFRLG
jgi:hypothetical protein